jgi:NB-ARC domain/WD domain, G-beta repeat/APAF-1 helical domain
MTTPRHFRVFLSSPGDVSEERVHARKVIRDELSSDPFLRSRATLEIVNWDDPSSPTPMLASLTPQDAIDRGLPKPSECDFVVVILWGRLGTPLADTVRKPDGERYLSGTEWEYENAISAKPKPEILIYRRTERVLLDADDGEYLSKLEQRKRVNEFFERFRSADGSYTGGVNTYDTPHSFAARLKSDLRTLLAAKFGSEGTPVGGLKSHQKRVPMMAPEPPADFVARPAEFEVLKKRLLDGSDAVAITAALKGAGGYGKTTLAKKLGHDDQIKAAYFDGILWVELGEKPADLLSIVSDLVEILSGDRPGLQNVNIAAAALAGALGDRRILMIVDDVWRERDLRPFLQGGPNTTRLITTRIDNVLPANAIHQPVDRMRDDEAMRLLAVGLPPDEVTSQRPEIGKLAARLGEWALLLKLVNGFLRERVVKSRQSLAHAIAVVNRRLDEKGLIAFDARKEGERTSAVARTIGVSLELLDEGRERFGELGLFPEDADIPIGIVARLWAETGHLNETDTDDLLSELYGLSLLLSVDLDRRAFRLHDTIRHFLRDAAGKGGLVTQNRRLLRSFDGIAAGSAADSLTRRYFYVNLPHHLAEAMERERLDALLLDPGWLKEKLAAIGNPQALVADYEQHGIGELQNFIGRTLRLTTGICTRDQRQLIVQLLGRVMGCKAAGTTSFLESARRHLSPPAILTQSLSLTPPGAEIARLEHSDAVTALCVLPDGRLASGSADHTIRLWDPQTGSETACLEGHSDPVTALCLLPDGRLASGSDDNTIRLWDPSTGAETSRLETDAPINCLSALQVTISGACIGWRSWIEVNGSG